MSGHKRATVSIGQDEYDRLREAEIRMRSLPEIPSVVQQTIQQQSAEALQHSVTEAQRRLIQYEQTIKHMSDQIVMLQSANSQRLSELESRMTVEVQQYTGMLWDRFEHLVSENNRYHQQTLAENQQQLQNQMVMLADQYQAVANEVEEKQSVTAKWINDAEQLLTFLHETFDCEQFAPGQLEKLDARLKQAYQNFQAGFFEAALPISQQVFLNLSDLHIELERAESEWQTLRLSVLEALNYIIELAKNSLVVEAIDLDGNPLSFQVYIDEWMGGRLSKWIDELMQFRDQIEAGQMYLDTETQQRLLSVDFPAYVQDLETMVLNARTMALNSQLRINIADLVIQALQDQGFTLDPQKDARYESNNVSLSYQVRLHNREGNEVFVNVMPGENGFGDNELHLLSKDAEARTEHELMQRWKEVSRSLRYYGLDVSGFEQVQEEQGRRRGSITARLASAAKKLRTGITTGTPEEGNEYRADP